MREAPTHMADTTPVSSNAKLLPQSFSGRHLVEGPTIASWGKLCMEVSSMIRLISSSVYGREREGKRVGEYATACCLRDAC